MRFWLAPLLFERSNTLVLLDGQVQVTDAVHR